MENQPTLRETKKHGAAWFPFNIYPCAIPQDFTQVALHWQDSMELVFVKKGRGIVQAGLTSYTAAAGDIYVFAPGVLHALRQLDNERMEYENIIFDLELLGGSGDVAAEKYLLPLQSGRLALPMRLTPDDWSYDWAANCLRAAEEFNKTAVVFGGFSGPRRRPAPRRQRRHPAVKGGFAAGGGALHGRYFHRPRGRRLRVQCQPLYAVVQGHDGPELYRVFE